ncbi:MAG: hypothetical protein ACKVIB_01590, partial [Pseudomonadales bacterium]
MRISFSGERISIQNRELARESLARTYLQGFLIALLRIVEQIIALLRLVEQELAQILKGNSADRVPNTPGHSL